MKKFFIYPLFLLFPLLSTAQTRITYKYDAAGNRVNREITIQSPKSVAKRNAVNHDDTSFSDVLHEHTIKIYPNPTDGLLKVYVSGLQNTDKCSFGIYTTQGVRIMADDVHADKFEINISNQPAGIYLLRIYINDDSTTWKIIKK